MKLTARILFSLTIAAAAHSLCLAQPTPQSNSLSPGDVAQVITEIKSPSANESTLSRAVALGGNLLRERRYPEAVELFSALAVKINGTLVHNLKDLPMPSGGYFELQPAGAMDFSNLFVREVAKGE